VQYPVRCECGQIHRVAATLAGSRFACPCGREVSVGSLSQLKLAAGEVVLSPDVRIEQMLQLGMLPQEDRCLICRKATLNKAHFWATCERAFVKKDASQKWWIILLAWLFLGWFFVILLFLRARDDQVHGTDVQFRLPLRVCPECSRELDNPQIFHDAVFATPIYAELLEKYPDAELVPE
jgi:hypothetical protein